MKKKKFTRFWIRHFLPIWLLLKMDKRRCRWEEGVGHIHSALICALLCSMPIAKLTQKENNKKRIYIYIYTQKKKGQYDKIFRIYIGFEEESYLKGCDQ